MKPTIALFSIAAFCLQMTAAPVRAEMSDDEKAAAALAILGIAALAHNKHHYREGYAPQSGDHTAEFERGYRDGVHGYAYNSFGSTVDYAEGYQAGDKERGNSTAHRQNTTAANKAPPMAMQGCAQKPPWVTTTWSARCATPAKSLRCAAGECRHSRTIAADRGKSRSDRVTADEEERARTF
jgi:hypothetical protein